MKHLDPAFQILSRYTPDPSQNLKLLMNRSLEPLPGENRPRVTRLVYGVVRHQSLLDHFLASRSRIPREKITGSTWTWLRMGLFLLAFSESFPDHAVVNEIVNRCDPGARGFANAMLRNLARHRDALREEEGRITDPALKYSISPLLISGLERISFHLDRDLDYLNRDPLFHLRANTRRISLSRLKEILHREDIPFREITGLASLEIKGAGNALRGVLDRGEGYIQNTGSQLVCRIAAHQARNRVLDGCAAPGTKALTLGQMNPDITVVAHDLRLSRLRLIRRFTGDEPTDRLHLAVSDLCRPALKNRFDLVLLDAPCTSSGTLRKNPDLKLKITREMIHRQAEGQWRMLQSVRENFPAAAILYSVCSFLPEETEGVMERFSPENRGYRFPDLSPLLESLDFSYRKARRGVYLLPQEKLNNDLFYLCLLEPAAGRALGVTD